MSLIVELKHIRVKKHLSQKWVGDRINMPQSHLSKIESEEIDPKLSTVIELVRVLDHELVLIPRSHLPMLNSLIKGMTDTSIDSPAWMPDDEEN